MLAALAAACVLATTASAADETVIAESPRAKLTLADVEAELAKLPPASRAQFAASRARLVQLLDNLYLNRALANEAREMGLDKDPVLAHQIALQVEKLLAQARIERLDKETTAKFGASPTAFESRARELYQAKPDRFRQPDMIHVSHVLVKVGPEGDAAARSRIDALRARIVGGASIGDVAREASDDPSVKRNGGDLGMVPLNKLEPEFAKAASALASPGDLSPVVKTSFGYHVIQLRAKKAGATRTFDEAKADLIAEIGKGLVDDARSHHQSAMFEPRPTVNDALIDKLHRDAIAKARDAKDAPPAKR